MAPPFFRKKPSGNAQDPSSLLRYLFPHVRRRARTRLHNLRFDVLPRLQRKAHADIYRYLVGKRLNKKQKSESGILARIRKRGSKFWGPRSLENGGLLRRARMAYREATGNGYNDQQNLSGWRAEGREPGARRKKLAGYLKAANELRQSYTQSWNARETSEEVDSDMPGAFPDAAVVRSGSEEMILFPSYARNHIREKVRDSVNTTCLTLSF